ncbi:IMPA2 monophosphatase, partial [Crocuta crocuta]
LDCSLPGAAEGLLRGCTPALARLTSRPPCLLPFRTVLPSPVTRAPSLLSLSSGGPLDLMSCRVVAAGTREMATLIAQALQTINYGRDDEK